MTQYFANVLFLSRRTDYVSYSEQLYGMKPLKKSYFKDAMEYFREEHENVAFLWVSDDMEWAKISFKNRKLYSDLFFVGSGDGDDDESIGYDLALLARSNHTIVSRGSFSMWAALLAGGEYYAEYGPIVPGRLLQQRQEDKQNRKQRKKKKGRN